jgi:hypothetical protein
MADEKLSREQIDKIIAEATADVRSAKGSANGSALIARLASLSQVEYDLQRKQEAKKLGIKLGTLDREVANLRAQQKLAHNFLPHWNVEPWPEEVDGAVLLNGLRQQFTRYVVLPAHAATALALWVLHTWVFGCFDITPYLSITSPTKRCGKTVLMTLLYWLSCRGKKTDSMSKAAIYRSVDGEKPTLVLDEVGWVVDLKDERQNVLCGGFERNGYAEVCEGEGMAITTPQIRPRPCRALDYPKLRPGRSLGRDDDSGNGRRTHLPPRGESLQWVTAQMPAVPTTGPATCYSPSTGIAPSAASPARSTAAPSASQQPTASTCWTLAPIPSFGNGWENGIPTRPWPCPDFPKLEM